MTIASVSRLAIFQLFCPVPLVIISVDFSAIFGYLLHLCWSIRISKSHKQKELLNCGLMEESHKMQNVTSYKTTRISLQ